MKVLVSIHDVTPAFAAEVRELWGMCEGVGVQPALLVVPNWHGEWPLEQHADFAAWIRCRAREGADVFLHGERHDEYGLPRRFSDDLRALGRTDREGEFLTLEREAAHERIVRGLERLGAVGLRPIGFVPPAWLARDACRVATRDAGLALSEDERAIHLHGRAMALTSPVLRWSARTSLRAWASVAVVRAASTWYRDHWLVRVALHPADLRNPVTARAITPVLQRWTTVRHPWRYSAL